MIDAIRGTLLPQIPIRGLASITDDHPILTVQSGPTIVTFPDYEYAADGTDDWPD